MTATLPIRNHPSRRIAPRKLSRGTIVRVTNQAGHFTVASIAGWGGPEYAVPVRYNLFHHESHQFVDHPADLVIPVEGKELAEASRMIAASKSSHEVERERLQEQQRIIQRDLALQQRKERDAMLAERMLALPDRTRKMAGHLLGTAVAETMEIYELAKQLVPKYRITHCWKCHKSLNNLDFDLCPTCRGIVCSCGACLCGRPW